MPSSGPFESPAVPEDLEELYGRELKAIGKVPVPRVLGRPHAGLAQILSKEERRREKSAQRGWSWDGPKLASKVDQRRLCILNSLFLALARREYQASASENDGNLYASARIGDTHVNLQIDLVSNLRTARHSARPATNADLPASTPLMLRIDGGLDGKSVREWQDDAAGVIETKLAEISARIIVTGEARFRRSLREAEERAEQHRLWEEKRRLDAIERRNAERLEHLRQSGELLRQAENLRSLIARVRDAVGEGLADVGADHLADWERWAYQEADRLDPIRSGQIMSHLGDGEGDPH